VDTALVGVRACRGRTSSATAKPPMAIVVRYHAGAVLSTSQAEKPGSTVRISPAAHTAAAVRAGNRTGLARHRQQRRRGRRRRDCRADGCHRYRAV